MKTPLLFIMVSLAVTCLGAGAGSFGVPDSRAPQHFAQCVRDSDHATFTVYDTNGNGPGRLITVNDRSWIERFAKILADAVYEPKEHLFATSQPIIFYSKQGKPLLGIQALPHNILRFDASDYDVGAKACASIRELLNELRVLSPPGPAVSGGHGAP